MRAKALLQWLFWGDSAAERRWAVALGVIFLALAVFLRVTGSEWREAAAERQDKAIERFERDGREFEDEAARDHAIFKSVGLDQWIQSGLYWAALGNLVLCGGLLVTRRWWVVRIRRIECWVGGEEREERGFGNGRFWIVVGAAVLLALAIRVPRMGLSLYNDEAYNFRHYIHGQFKDTKDGGREFDAVTWKQTMWKNKANNGVPFSALARLAQGDAPPGEIRESRLKLAALLPGVLSIAVVALLGFRLGGGLAGGAAAIWMALHPWHVRYCTEARPYGLVLLFAALAMLCLFEAGREDRWRWWLGFAAAQFFLVWSFAGAVYLAAGLNVAAFAWCLKAGGGRPLRLVVGSTLSAMLYLQLMAPCFPQMLHTLATLSSLKGSLGAGLVADIGSYLAVGMPAVDRDPTNAANPALAKFSPWGWPLLVIAVAVLFWACFRSARGSMGWKLLVGGCGLAGAFALAMSAYSGAVVNRWYLIYLLPVAGLVLANGWAWCWAEGRRWRIAGTVSALLLMALSARALSDYLRHGKQSLREVAALASADGAIATGFWTDVQVYAPSLVGLENTDDLAKWIESARSDGKPLTVVFGHRDLAVKTNPDLVEMVEGEQFEEIGVFPGLEEAQFTTRVYRWKGGGGNRRAEARSTAPESGS